MNKTKIEWCDYTWNPVTGCMHGCEYCYARSIAHRFLGFEPRCGGEEIPDGIGTCIGSIYNTTHGEMSHVFNKQPMRRVAGRNYPSGKFIKASYPYDFEPTFHRYRLGEPQTIKKLSNIFVCSMADLFGDWVPDEWIQEVFKACEATPWHRYLFLTKNPERYCDLSNAIYNLAMTQYSPEIWMGVTITGVPPNMFNNSLEPRIKSYLSIEPYLQKISWIDLDGISWVIVGAETGNRKGKIIPKQDWIEDIVNECRAAGVPVFMKNSLASIWGEELIQEYPW